MPHITDVMFCVEHEYSCFSLLGSTLVHAEPVTLAPFYERTYGPAGTIKHVLTYTVDDQDYSVTINAKSGEVSWNDDKIVVTKAKSVLTIWIMTPEQKAEFMQTHSEFVLTV